MAGAMTPSTCAHPRRIGATAPSSFPAKARGNADTSGSASAQANPTHLNREHGCTRQGSSGARVSGAVGCYGMTHLHFQCVDHGISKLRMPHMVLNCTLEQRALQSTVAGEASRPHHVWPACPRWWCWKPARARNRVEAFTASVTTLPRAISRPAAWLCLFPEKKYFLNLRARVVQ